MKKLIRLLDTIEKNHPLPDKLYHYTTQKGLFGIIEDKCIWATDIRYLNDSTEWFGGIALFLKALKKEKEKRENSDEKKLLSLIKNSLETLKFFENEKMKNSVYLCSFSEDKDHLSQWRAYSSNDVGYNIGFKLKTIKNIIELNKKKFVHFKLVPCIYKLLDQIDLVKKLIEETFNAYNYFKNENEKDKSFILYACNYFMNNFYELVPLIKNENFYAEKEWRLVTSFAKNMFYNLQHRKGKFMPIPFIKFDFVDDKNKDRLLIYKVHIGPTPHAELSKRSVISLLSSNNIEYKSVENSIIPYRGSWA